MISELSLPPDAQGEEQLKTTAPDNSANDSEKRDSTQNEVALAGHRREYVTGVKRWLILGPVTLTYFTYFLDQAVLSTATPAITSEFNSLVDVGWYGGAYQLGGSVFQPLTGKIFRHFSIKVGSAICGAAHSSTMFIVGRAVAGVGSAGISNGALTIISAILPPRAQANAMGVNMGLGQLGLALGPIVGGLFTQYVSWRWCFYINLPIGGVVGILLLLLRIPEPEPKPPVRQVLSTAIKALDLPGFMIIAPGTIMFLLGLQFGGNQYAWNSSVVIGLLVGGIAALALFLVWEYRQGDGAMIPFAMLRHRIIWSSAGNMFFLIASVLVADFYLAIYFQAIHDDSPLMSGVHMLPTTLGIVLFTMISGGGIEALGYYLPWVVAGATMSTIGYGLLSLLSPTTTTGKWIGFQVFYGVGGGLMAAGAFIAVQNLVPAPQIPTAMSIVLFSQNMGGAISLVAANAIFSNVLRSELQQRFAEIGLSADDIINVGVRSIRELVSGNRLVAVLQAYSNSVDRVMYLGIAVSIAAFAFGWGLGFKDIRKEKELTAMKSDRLSHYARPCISSVAYYSNTSTSIIPRKA
ncbi:major facilitator superfamily domain-containing protein [Xylariales sp. PMI_506]|nr:major facilitator superfamily domain-containing protein [Xylariales sp. PMI_506]